MFLNVFYIFVVIFSNLVGEDNFKYKKFYCLKNAVNEKSINPNNNFQKSSIFNVFQESLILGAPKTVLNMVENCELREQSYFYENVEECLKYGLLVEKEKLIINKKIIKRYNNEIKKIWEEDKNYIKELFKQKIVKKKEAVSRIEDISETDIIINFIEKEWKEVFNDPLFQSLKKSIEILEKIFPNDLLEAVKKLHSSNNKEDDKKYAEEFLTAYLKSDYKKYIHELIKTRTSIPDILFCELDFNGKIPEKSINMSIENKQKLYESLIVNPINRCNDIFISEFKDIIGPVFLNILFYNQIYFEKYLKNKQNIYEKIYKGLSIIYLFLNEKVNKDTIDSSKIIIEKIKELIKLENIEDEEIKFRIIKADIDLDLVENNLNQYQDIIAYKNKFKENADKEKNKSILINKAQPDKVGVSFRGLKWGSDVLIDEPLVYFINEIKKDVSNLTLEPMNVNL